MQNVSFFPFPTKLKAPKQRKIWLSLLRRDDYDPPRHHRLCSEHFVDGYPSENNPYPTLFSYNNFKYPQKPRSSSAISKRTRYDSEYEDVLSSVELEDEEAEIMPMDVYTDHSAGIDIPEEEVIVETSCLEDEDVTTKCKPVKDHTYCYVDKINEPDTPSTCTKETSTQTDLVMEDMIFYEQQKERLENPESLLRELFVEKITSSDEKVRKYLGVPSIVTLFGIFAILEKISPTLKYWRGNKLGTHHQTAYQNDLSRKKSGPQRKLTKFHEYIITLLKIRLAISSQLLADIFGISTSRISQIFTTWTNYMFIVFSSLLKWPSSKKLQKFIPNCFKKAFPKTTCIIDCTEFFIERPSTPTAQSQTYSSYKHKNTFKALVSITPSGAFSFISDLWGGNVSDRFITENSGFLENIRRGDEVMADRGFLIRDLLLERGATLNIPPFTKKCTWGKGKRLTAADIKKTREIAKLRIHVERAIGRLKNYRILSNTIPLSLKHLANQILKVCAFLCNLQPPLVQK